MRRTFVLALGAAMVLMNLSCKEEKASAKVEASNVEVAAERDAASKKLPVMSFDKKEHDFGTIVNGTPQEYTFTFTNTGEAPLIITNASSSCGCTVPTYPKNTPIAPGEKGTMVVKFNGAGNGAVSKTVTVNANTAAGSELLKIKAFVNPKDAAAQASIPLKKG
ncbi:DUF1573 domain-containing protein [Sediminicola luteus]|uniref:DUF1573 domain-containing protein n=1 Tax=Sediminicola luteus TaxID=319238 RepID=A0A2A4G853_9FLAO|nr:DUF1573 domain-containing protein [Sediminicola luteus]PCE64613.1 hypothetical protein B7P33_08280 [Sediminicola luteus]